MKIKRIFALYLVFLAASFFYPVIAQTAKYWVFFTDKEGASFDPYGYFDPKAIERRLQHGYDLFDPTDFPVRTDYQEIIGSMVENLTFTSRWFNAVSVRATSEQIQALQHLPFVASVREQYLVPVLAAADDDDETEPDDQAIKVRQVQMMQGGLFRKMGITGKGVRIAVFDAGFPKVDSHPAFQQIRDENRILKTWDFTKKKEYVYHANSHGLSVLSNIAGIDTDGQLLGLATGAEFLLAITEVSSEPFREEEWWLAAAEWADKNGAQLISSSLGYTYHRYFPQDMDGKTSLVSRAANMAASKGILVVNAAGNEGSTKNWKVIGAPADADSVLSVGGIDPATGVKVDFSSLGPTVDGRMKPNVSNAGVVVAANKKGRVSRTQGTSFAAPLTTGFAACAMEALPGKTNMEMFELLQQSSHLYPYFDYAHGYGIPQASFFTGMLRELDYPGVRFLVEDGYLRIVTQDYESSEGTFPEQEQLMEESEGPEEDAMEEDGLDPVTDYMEETIDSIPPPEIYDAEIEMEAPEIEIEVPEMEDEVYEETELIELEEVDSPEMEEDAGDDKTEISGDLEEEDALPLDYESEISDWETLFPDYLYYHIQLPEGKLSKYAVVKVAFDPLVEIYLEDLPQGTIVRFFYKGFTGEWFKE